MESMLADMPQLRIALLCAAPLLYVLAAAGASGRSPDAGWRLARWTAGLAVGAALLSLVWLMVGGPGLARGQVLGSLGDAGTIHLSLRSDALGCLMLLLVSFIGWVIVGYSQPYLGGER